jgi:hypothetical protein
LRPTGWFEGSLSGLISLVLHMTAFLVIALWQTTQGSGGAGEGQEVLIGPLPVKDLVDRPEEQLAVAEVQKQQSSDTENKIEVEVPSAGASAAAEPAAGGLSATTLSASGGAIGNFDLGSVQVGGSAAGGGDTPEAVDEGLYWSSSQNQFRPAARKVILLFGDAPPHRDKLQRCLQIASDFRRGEKGVVSTVTCRNRSPLPEFYEIAMAGGGEAFLTSNDREIMSQLMILVIGSQHRQKVLEAFRLMEK